MGASLGETCNVLGRLGPPNMIGNQRPGQGSPRDILEIPRASKPSRKDRDKLVRRFLGPNGGLWGAPTRSMGPKQDLRNLSKEPEILQASRGIPRRAPRTKTERKQDHSNSIGLFPILPGMRSSTWKTCIVLAGLEHSRLESQGSPDITRDPPGMSHRQSLAPKEPPNDREKPGGTWDVGSGLREAHKRLMGPRGYRWTLSSEPLKTSRKPPTTPRQSIGANVSGLNRTCFTLSGLEDLHSISRHVSILGGDSMSLVDLNPARTPQNH